jgi:predicted nucleic acid-binding protein
VAVITCKSSLSVFAIDALHVACAEAAGAEYFLTCDDRLLKKQKYIKISSMNPLDFVQKVSGEQS